MLAKGSRKRVKWRTELRPGETVDNINIKVSESPVRLIINMILLNGIYDYMRSFISIALPFIRHLKADGTSLI